MRRNLSEGELLAVAAALWLVMRDKDVRRAFVDLANDNRDSVEQMIDCASTAYNAIVRVPAP